MQIRLEISSIKSIQHFFNKTMADFTSFEVDLNKMLVSSTNNVDGEIFCSLCQRIVQKYGSQKQ